MNAINKKDGYCIALIKETLAQLKDAKFFNKIDICQIFYWIKILEYSEKLTTFFTRFGIFNYLLISFGLWNRPVS